MDAAGQVVLARRPVHWHYEPVSLKTLMVLDMPGLFIGSIVTLPLRIAFWKVEPSRETRSYFDFFMWLVLSSAQWWVVGTYVHIKLKRRAAQQTVGADR